MNAQRGRPISIKLAGVVAIAFVALCSQAAMGQSGPLKIVVPFPPGGSADILARLVADQLGRAQGVSTVIENRPGAGTIVATEAVSHATPDGNTLLINANSFIINPNLRKLVYDPFTDFEPVCYLVRSPQVIVVNTTSPYHTLKDLLEAARAKPGDVTMASVGPATTQHIAIAMLEHAAQVKLTYIPYPGGAPAVNALLGEHVMSVLANYSEVFEQVHAGKLRALATTLKSRTDTLPDVPTVAESGYKDYEAEVWFGLVAPAKTPADTIARLAGWLVAALQVPDIKSKLMTLGLYPVGTCGAAYGAHIRQQYDAYARAIKESNIKGE
jgi:tripartite-type tricarboxylate transporter receptor subunit TctC